MKAEELRIGNLIQDSKGQIREIRGIDYYSECSLWLRIPMCKLAIGRHALRVVEPIPLTEVILLKCGFSKEQIMPNNPSEGYYFSMRLSTEKFCDLALISLNNDTSLEVGLFPYKSIFKIKYLHRLQNLYFALTGEELKISL